VPREGAINVEGTVVEVLRETLFRVELSNRHRFLAHVAGKRSGKRIRLSPGDRVTVEMSPYDLSQGRITLEQDR
jgi:translation initiation factor IF-1